MNEQMRKEFEAWAEKEGFNIDRFGDGYDMPSANYAWQAWQASRAAIVVELPDWFVFGIDAALYRDDVIKALDKAGVSYK